MEAVGCFELGSISIACWETAGPKTLLPTVGNAFLQHALVISVGISLILTKPIIILAKKNYRKPIAVSGYKGKALIDVFKNLVFATLPLILEKGTMAALA